MHLITPAHRIEQKRDITREDYAHIRELELRCRSSEKITFKLELDFKLADAAKEVPEDPGTNSNEFLWYDEGRLIGYIGICSFGGMIDPPELTGMVHPDHRRQGIFSSLLGLALEECGRRKNETVLLCDRNSSSGRGFLDRIGAVYSYSEYEMRLEDRSHKNPAEQRHDISIRRTSNAEEEEKLGMAIWSAEKDGVIIGKVHLQLINGVGGIYGLSVLPENRGKGYGRPILEKAIETLRQGEATEILLQVNTENWIAHNLYKSCGFRETSVMDYFTLDTSL